MLICSLTVYHSMPDDLSEEQERLSCQTTSQKSKRGSHARRPLRRAREALMPDDLSEEQERLSCQTTSQKSKRGSHARRPLRRAREALMPDDLSEEEERRWSFLRQMIDLLHAVHHLPNSKVSIRLGMVARIPHPLERSFISPLTIATPKHRADN